ncbi:MAG: Ig-like domain-containing protein [Betaproteobacteria bacterium]
MLLGGFSVATPPPVNHPPAISSQPLTAATDGTPYAYQMVAADADNDPLAYSLTQAPDGMTVSAGGVISWTPATAQIGSQSVAVTVSDGRGGTTTQSFTVVVEPGITAIDATPALLRFSSVGVDRPLAVTALRSDGSSIDVTALDTTYESSNTFVATVNGGGAVHAVANGNATITVHHGSLTDTAAVMVETGVTLDSLDLSPPAETLRSVPASYALTLRGHFSNGDVRDLTAAAGTVYQSSNPAVATVDATGHVTATGPGDAAVTARTDTLTASAAVHVFVSTGVGFLRGVAFDDSKGLPLAGASVTLVADGGGPLAPPTTTTADEQGRFAVEGRAGDAIVRIEKAGFTSVERSAPIPEGSAATLLDARLTPVDARANTIASAFGGEADDTTLAFRLTVPPGGLAANTDLRLTPISGQGLKDRLPFGWSPVAAVDISPAGLTFSQTASLAVPNAASLAAGAGVVVATYDTSRHAWIAVGTAQVSGDGRSIVVPLAATGQIACVAADDAPFTPATPAIGDVLGGSPGVALPADITATGTVVPRSAPPGDKARAVGRVLLRSTAPLPSGTVLRASVTERFDLADQSQIVPQPFGEDIVLYSRGRPTGDGILGASFPITPSRSFTIQELLTGVVSVDVNPPAAGTTATILGAAGGTITNASGDTLEIPASALAGDTVSQLRREDDQTILPVPSGFDLVAALYVDLAGATLAQPARLSIAAPSSVQPGDQLLLALVFQDPAGTLRLRIVGVGAFDAGRIASVTGVGTLGFQGVTAGGHYLFLRSQQPVGFLAGRVLGTDGTTPKAQTLVTADTTPFADASSASGAFVVAGLVGADTALRALDTLTHDAAARTVHVNTRDEVVASDVTLAVTALTVISTAPAANATNVALDTSLSIDFSDALDPASISDASAALQTGGAPVAIQQTLSSDRRRLVIRPSAPLQGKSTYSLALAGLKTTTGRPLTGFTALTFTTLDPSRPAVIDSGIITADLPDQDGFVLITGGAGAAEASSAVTATNLRTQETATVLADGDGSFRVRVSALIGDELSIGLNDSSGREATISLDQLRGADGTTTVSERGGSIAGAHGRLGTILPRALSQAGLFRIDDLAAGVALAALPAGFTYVDQFHFSADAAQFNSLSGLTLAESQNRFPAQSSSSAPFVASGQLTVPADFLVSGSLRFTATAVDRGGIRRSASSSVVVVASGADGSSAESSQAADFPTVFVVAPKQAVPGQAVETSAVAPAARVDLEIPAPAGLDPAATLLLVRSTTVDNQPKLLVLDAFSIVVRDGVTLLRTSGRELPGMSTTGDYAVVASSDPISFVTGRLSGSTAIASLDNSPFVFRTDGPNGSFALPARAGQPFSIQYLDASSGAVVGTSSGNAPATGGVDLGQPLAPPASGLTVTADPDAHAIVDIGEPLTFHFSEPVDGRTLAGGIVVTDGAGARAIGSITLASDGATATFKPSRRWKFGTTYRWGVATSVVAVSGVHQTQAAAGAFTTFAPTVVGTAAIGAAHDVAVAGALAVAATDAGLLTIDVSSPLAPAVQGQVPLDGGAHGVALLPSTTFTDRLNQTHAGTFATVADGGAAGTGRLDVIDVTTAAAPVGIGSARVSASGGTPSAVALTSDQRALVGIQGVGVAAVGIAGAVPADSGNPASPVAARYPSGANEDINQAAVLGERVLTAGAAGLTVLDAATLTRRGGASTAGNAQGVAVLPAFSMDVNGDGTIDAAAETFDLALVANGADGALQF